MHLRRASLRDRRTPRHGRPPAHDDRRDGGREVWPPSPRPRSPSSTARRPNAPCARRRNSCAARRAVRERGIEAMPIKGPAWAERLYGDVTLRNWVDLDLLVELRADAGGAGRPAWVRLHRQQWPFNARLLRRETRAEGELPVLDRRTARPCASTSTGSCRWATGHRGLTADGLLARAEPLGLLGRDVLHAVLGRRAARALRAGDARPLEQRRGAARARVSRCAPCRTTRGRRSWTRLPARVARDGSPSAWRTPAA